MALNFLSNSLLKRRDQPPLLGKTSNDSLTVCPPKPMSPDQRLCEGMCILSAIHKIFGDGVRALRVFHSAGHIVLQMEFTIVLSSKSPSTFDVTPFLPFNSTGCMNGHVVVSKSSLSMMYKSTQ